MIRVVAYNLSGGLDVGAAARVLEQLAPRIVCVLEAPTGTRLRRLSRMAGLNVAARSGRGRGRGSAVLVHPDVHVTSTASVPLTTPRDVPRRDATHVLVRAGGMRLSVTAVQLGLRPDYRLTNVDELRDFLASIDAPSLVGCDLNESVRAPVAAALAERYQDAHAVAGNGGGETYPTADPSTRQDFVFIDPSLEVLGCFTSADDPASFASHHLPVVCDLAGRDDDATRLPVEERDTPGSGRRRRSRLRRSPDTATPRRRPA